MPEVVCVGEEGGLTITFTVADECGNETTCTSTIRIEDTIPVRSSPTARQILVLVCDGDYEQEIADWLAAARTKP